jgi:hypothetical protein
MSAADGASCPKGSDKRGERRLELRRPPVYDQLADAIRGEILAGKYEPSEGDVAADELPGAAELAPSTA